MQINNPQDCIILIDKVKGVTSFCALSRIKKLINKKAGHAGTLDKFATGLLIVLCGKKTKLCEKFMGYNKTYIASIKLSEETLTDDPEGEITQSNYTLIPTLDEINTVLEKKFSGDIMQSPPKFSAIHINGKRAYELALKDVDFTPEMRKVSIKFFRIISYSYPILDIEFEVSKGTYIRSIARDLGRELGCYAHLVELRRTKIGQWSVNNAVKSDSIELPLPSSAMLVD